MNLKDAREFYYFHTGKVSEIVRQLALAAIAIVWLFRTGEVAAPTIPAALMLPLKLVVVGLTLDLLQYAFGALGWGLYQWSKDRKNTPEAEEIRAPRAINWPSLVLFWSKISVVSFAYYLLITYIAGVITSRPT